MSNLKVLMLPHPVHFRGKSESGIRRVVEAYARYLSDFGVRLVDPDAKAWDIKATHAGLAGGDTDVAMLHGMYWSADYKAPAWEYASNRNIVEAVRAARKITVPSRWVSETFQRDMRLQPYIIPHGIEWGEWQHNHKPEPYILWNKNRDHDVCDPTPMARLAQSAPNIRFVSTFAPNWMDVLPSNLNVVGLKPHDVMKTLVQKANIYLSTTKETFGIGILEALASGVPVLGFDWGGNQELVQHGVNGYLAQDQEDLLEGLHWVLAHRQTLSANARELAKSWDWPSAVEKVAQVYKAAAIEPDHDVTVVIPAYNYAEVLTRAVNSALSQTLSPKAILIIDDGSTDDTPLVGQELAQKHDIVAYVRKPNGGVASARNLGVGMANTTYVVCMDADDEIEPRFLEACVDTLKSDRSIGIAYTKITTVYPDGREELSNWPEDSNFDAQIRPRNPNNLRGHNQVPTCAVFRKELWERSGGYREKYAPLGAGSEDAEFWTQIGAMGYKAKLATDQPLFRYSLGTGRVSGGSESWELREPLWLADFPWVHDGQHPFASQATPVKASHPVRQYDQPEVSIIIPVGKAHRKLLHRALNSVEAQSYRNWEVIVVFDDATDMDNLGHWGIPHYPYVRALYSGLPVGAGAARNMGVEHARGDFLVFLDADDELHMDFLSDTLRTWKAHPNSIVYTDYIRTLKVGESELSQFHPHLISYERGVAQVRSRAADYDWELAQDPIGKKIYHWCMVTCLIPKAFHVPFDETMPTYEDVLYHWVLARKGISYVRLEKPLINYHMDTSTRRVLGENLSLGKEMLQYAQDKLQEVEKVACATCPGQRAKVPVNVIKDMESKIMQMAKDPKMQDENYQLIEYQSTSRGKHNVRGIITKVDYGYRAGGDRFYVHKDDMRAHPALFKAVDPDPSPPKVHKVAPTAPVAVGVTVADDVVAEQLAVLTGNQLVTEAMSSPHAGEQVLRELEGLEDDEPTGLEAIDVELLPGITVAFAKKLRADNILNAADVLSIGKEGLLQYNITEAKAEILLSAIHEMRPK